MVVGSEALLFLRSSNSRELRRVTEEPSSRKSAGVIMMMIMTLITTTMMTPMMASMMASMMAIMMPIMMTMTNLQESPRTVGKSSAGST